MKNKIACILAFCIFAAPAAAQEERKLSPVEYAGKIVGHAKLCQNFGLKMLGDRRVIALEEELKLSPLFNEERERVLRRFRGVDAITNLDSSCREVSKRLDEIVQYYGLKVKKR